MSTELRERCSPRAAAILAALALVTLSACASEPQPRPTRLDPSNPSAPEAPAASFTPLFGSGPVADAPGAPEAQPASSEHDHAAHETEEPAAAVPAAAAHHQHGAREQSGDKAAKPKAGAATTYTCPMHPEVTADKPGRCPKCGMNLIPRKGDSGGKP